MFTYYHYKKFFLSCHLRVMRRFGRDVRRKKSPALPGLKIVASPGRRSVFYACAASAFTRAVNRETFRDAVFL
jgi:hypothetical protein